MSDTEPRIKPEEYRLTEEHKAQLEPWADRWIKIALRTKPMTGDEWTEAHEQLIKLYEASELKPPTRIARGAGPMSSAIAAAVAAAAWYLRDHPNLHQEICGGDVTESEVLLAMVVSTAILTGLGMHELIGDVPEAQRTELTLEEAKKVAARVLPAASRKLDAELDG